MTYRLAIVPRALVTVDEFGGSAEPAVALRHTCLAAVRECTAERRRVGLIITPSERALHVSPQLEGSFRPWGVDVSVSAGASISELLGRWLVQRAGEGSAESRDEVSTYCSIEEALCAGETALVVLIDGAFGLGEQSPTGAINGADELDEVCRRIAGDDIGIAESILAGFELPGPGADCSALWRELARLPRIVAGNGRGDHVGVGKRLHYSASPYGIGYHVASWQVEQEGSGDE